MPTVTSSGGAFVPSLGYDRTGAADYNIVQNIPPIPVATTTYSPSSSIADNKVIVFNSAAGGTVTLPPATGSGMRVQIIIGTTVTSNTFVVKVASSTDFMRGAAMTVGAAAATFLTANSGTVATESDTITFNRGTTGLGTIGDFIELIDIAAAVWWVQTNYASSGTAATPFSAAV